MKIRLYDDLHLEFGNPFEIPSLKHDDDTVLVLAGDIELATDAVPFIEKAAERFKAVIYVVGNHEYYYETFPMVPQQIEERLERGNSNNVYVLDSTAVTIDDTRFIGGTLWTDFNNGNAMDMMRAQQKMTDYHLIRQIGGAKLIPDVLYEAHQRTKRFIISELSNREYGNYDKQVVVTHHAPSFQCLHGKYRGEDTNPAYASNLEDVILEFQPELWLFGHTHESTETVIGKTRIYNNPYGYYSDGINPNFDIDGKVVEI